MGILFRAAGKKKRFAVEAPAYITITPVSVVGFVVSETLTLSAIVYGTRGTALPLVIAWSSSDITKVTVSTVGVMTAIASGSATITARVGTITQTLAVTVLAAQTTASVTVTPSTMTLTTGQITNVYARVLNAGAVELTGQTVTWSSLTPATATVGSDSGDPVHTCQVTAVAAGTVTIRATSGGFTADCTLTVQTAGLYTAITGASRIWSDYANDAAMKAARTFGVEANLGIYRPAFTAASKVLHSTSATYTGNCPTIPAVCVYLGETAMNMAIMQLRARTAGTAGNDITIVVTQPGASRNVVDVVVKDHPTAPTVTETYTNQTGGLGVYTTLNASSALVEALDYSDLGDSTPQVGTFQLSGGSIGVKATVYRGRNASSQSPGRMMEHAISLSSGGPYYNWWARWYNRFSTNWNTEQRTLPVLGEGSDQKWVGGRMSVGGGRVLVNIGQGSRRCQHTPGINAIAPIVAGSWVGIPGSNWLSTDATYGSQGWPSLELHTAPWLPWDVNIGPPGATRSVGDGEWYEWIIHHNTRVGATTAQNTFSVRRYTTSAGAVVSPSAWRHSGTQVTYVNPMPAVYVPSLLMGEHRNGAYSEDMWAAWGNFEVVDGSVYADPFGLGFGVAAV